MLGDEAQPAGEARREGPASGPRHAAPRKSLLTKLHMPAGKAVALAAMPTALLMGLGFTPHLAAQADELPKSPFKPGPCVTQPDTPPATSGTGDTAGKDGADTGTDAKDGKDAAGGSGKDTAAPEPSASPSPSATATRTPKPAASPSADTSDKKAETVPTASPSPSASPTKSVNPLDPLGLGDLLGGLLGMDGKSSDSTAADSSSDTAPAATPTPSATAPAAPEPSTTTAPPSVSDTVKSTVESADTAVKGAEDTVKSVTDGAAKTAKGVTDAAKDAATGDKSSTGTSAGTSGDSGDPQSFPCPTLDAKALADAETEQGIPPLADTPWVLKSSLLTLYGLKYEGIVKVRTANGTVKDVLKFTATGVDIGDLSQTVDGPNGTKTHVTARKGSTSTIRNGTVTMYTESISGNLLGAVPITFTPKAPPPLVLPVLFFTDCTVVQAAQFGGDLTVPGMHLLPGQAS